MLLLLVLAVLAYLLADSQSQDREDVRKRFQDVATVSASVTNGIFQSSLMSSQQAAAARLGGADVSDAAVRELASRGRLAYAAVLDSRARVLASTDDLPPSFGDAVDTARESGAPLLSDVMKLGDRSVIEWAIPFEAESGRRIYVQGIPAAAFGEFLANSLGEIPNLADAETVMVDGKGVVLGGVNLSTDPGETLPDDALLDAVAEQDSGTYGDGRYFAAGSIENSPFRIVLDVEESELYDEIPASRKTLPWVIFAAFALTALAGLFLLGRVLRSAAEIEKRELNERHAVEINDNIIQGLALAKYQLQRGEGEASAAQLADTLREAQRLVSGLLGDAEVQAGQLRREAAAETRGPDDASSA